MKIMFNEIGGKSQKLVFCDKCVFDNSRFCCASDSENSLFISCEGGFIETNLDIFEL